MVGDPSSHAISAAAGLLNTGISMFLLPHLPGWHGAADLGPSSTGRGRPYGQLNTILTGLDHGIVGSYMQGLYPVAHRTSKASIQWRIGHPVHAQTILLPGFIPVHISSP